MPGAKPIGRRELNQLSLESNLNWPGLQKGPGPLRIRAGEISLGPGAAEMPVDRFRYGALCIFGEAPKRLSKNAAALRR
jgi:hypothetical protein